MISDPVLKELSHIVGPQYLTTQHEHLEIHATDATKLAFMPDAVAFPGSGEEISRILLLANHKKFPVIPRGAGSGKSGGAIPVNGGLVLSMERLNRILDIDEQNLIAKVEPGVITSHLQEKVEELSLFYPPDPASIHISTIGGNVAENAGGLRAVKYGVTRDYVLGMTVVLPTGEIIKTGVETAKGVVGYDLTRLIVGSEGTLAVLVSVTLRLIPKPPTTRTMMAFFRTVPLAVQTVSDVIRNKVVPTAMEFMDQLSIDCVREDIGIEIPPETGALLLIEVDGEETTTRSEAKKVKEICFKAGALDFQSASGKEESERLWEVRRKLSESIFKLRPDKVSEDIVVPRSRMANLVSTLDLLGQKYHLPIPAFGHAGDGNIHVNIMFDKSIPTEAEAVEEVVRVLFTKVIELNGTLSGEHGVGLTKAPYLEMEVSKPALQLMARLKKAFDPQGILNPGKIFTGDS
jgi:glycolate oxidase